MVTQSNESEQGHRANVGDEAPDFSLRGAGGVLTTLSELRGKKRALLIFYPG
jgi:peroxiredoxin